MQVSQEFDTAGPVNVDALPAAVAEGVRQAEEAFGGLGESVEFTARDHFASVVGGLIMVSCARIMFNAPASEVSPEIADLINDNLGAGPASLGYLIADLAEIMLSDPLDQIPTRE